MDKFFDSILATTEQQTVSVWVFLLCVAVAALCGGAYAGLCALRQEGSRSFRGALVFLPPIVCVVIMMVNGNVGIGVAVAGAFSLVRFRSAQGSAKEICAIFAAMGSGLIAGVGYLAYAVLFTLLICLLYIALCAFGERGAAGRERILKITVPEDLFSEEAFAGVLETYTDRYRTESVRTSHMGSLFKLTYRVCLKAGTDEKAFIDDLRVRNGNLEIALLRGEENESL